MSYNNPPGGYGDPPGGYGNPPGGYGGSSGGYGNPSGSYGPPPGGNPPGGYGPPPGGNQPGGYGPPPGGNPPGGYGPPPGGNPPGGYGPPPGGNPPGGYGNPPGGYGDGPGGYGPPPGNYGPGGYGPGPGGYGNAPAANYANWLQRVGGYLIDVIPAIILEFIGIATHNTGVYLLCVIIAIAIIGYNRWFLAGKTGQSWGKKALGLSLVSENTGQPIGAGMAFVRDICHIVDSITCYIGWLFPLWDSKRQTLADKIMKTVVVPAA
jgi:uncharacterized RDD family membrane protein YckC